MDSGRPPIFSAVSASARQLSVLLRCISFWRVATVQITKDGLRFAVEEARAVQGITFLEKALFSSYSFLPTNAEECSSSDDLVTSHPSFQINLLALLEVLQIFGLSDVTQSRSSLGGLASTYSHNAFNTPALAVAGGTCRLSYAHVGAPLSITITETGITTTCDLNTYEYSGSRAPDVDETIPLQRDALTFKMIMRSVWLYDAINELALENSTVLTLTASEHSSPLFALEGSGGPFGDATVEYRPESKRSRDAGSDDLGQGVSGDNLKKVPQVAEVFTVFPTTAGSSRGRIRERYPFDQVRKAARSMEVANKVCIRCDRQGVLSLQFMIDLSATVGGGGSGVGSSNANNNNNGAAASASTSVRQPVPGRGLVDTGHVSFVDFRFVPLLDDEDDSLDDKGDSHEEDGMSDEGGESQ